LLLLVTGVALLLLLRLPPRRIFLDADGPDIDPHLPQHPALGVAEFDLAFPWPWRLRAGSGCQQQQRQGDERFH
jgi:hypothetical protein